MTGGWEPDPRTPPGPGQQQPGPQQPWPPSQQQPWPQPWSQQPWQQQPWQQQPWQQQPWQQQPAWQPYEPPPVRGHRRRLVVALVVVVAALVGGVVALVQQVRPLALRGPAVERDVAAQYREQHDVGVRLTCPPRMPVASGEVYRCAGVTDDGRAVSVEIRIDDSLDGAYGWVG